ncbi:hypothetical protein D9V86_01790 [Bacteroidetes/Chlorobi group bacterium ChocPot_Mid]|nr:MAG: hypothetical protein D9V86_01790 [Bacteroidetes/Chlorobi group bacterium ChocPot_Mid]
MYAHFFIYTIYFLMFIMRGFVITIEKKKPKPRIIFPFIKLILPKPLNAVLTLNARRNEGLLEVQL